MEVVNCAYFSIYLLIECVSERKTFREMVQEALKRGLTVIPVNPDSKAAVESGWQAKGYRKEEPLASDFSDGHNLGALCSKDGTWILDVDSVDWFTSEFPKELLPALNTFAVKTGGGAFQFHFLQDDLSRERLGNRSLTNPDKKRWKKPTGAECEAVFDVLHDRKQGLLPGSVHPTTRRLYEVHKDLPLVPASAELVDWIARSLSKKSKKKEAGKSPFKLRQGWMPDAELEKAGLKYDAQDKAGDRYFFYHAWQDCLVRKPDTHVRPGESRNHGQCAFVWNRERGEFWHWCLSAGCEPGIVSTKKALEELGLNWGDIFSAPGLVRASVVWGDSVEEEPTDPLWPDWIYRGELAVAAGFQGIGKSPVWHDFTARVSSGTSWPDGTSNECGPQRSLILAAEDDISTVIIPRFKAMGAVLSNVGFVRMTQVTKDMEEVEKLAALDSDLDELSRLIAEVEPAFILIDPITSYLGKAKMNAEDEVRPMLTKFRAVLKRHRAACVYTAHNNKKIDVMNPAQRVMGAQAFSSVPRTVILMGEDPDAEDKFSHAMTPYRNLNTVGALKYRTVGQERKWPDDKVTTVVTVEWMGKSFATPDDSVGYTTESDRDEMSEMADLVREFLKPGKKKTTEVRSMIEASGHKWPEGNTSRLRKKAGASHEGGGRVWFLTVPEDKQESF